MRKNFLAWGTTGDVADYAAAYSDWLQSLDRIPFHRSRTKPILEDAGLTNSDIGWLPFVKAPLPAGSSPGDDLMDIDIDVVWEQLQLIKPRILWIQGIGISDRVIRLAKGRITDQILPPQSVSQYENSSKQRAEKARIATRLREYLGDASLPSE